MIGGGCSPPTMKASGVRGTIGMGDDGGEVVERMVAFPRCLTRPLVASPHPRLFRKRRLQNAR
jgi:hypothetical protein